MTRRIPFTGRLCSLLLAALCAFCVPSFAETGVVRGMAVGLHGSAPLAMAALGDRFLFDADDGTFGKELWATKGPGEIPLLVADINSGGGSSNPGCFAVLGDRLYFAANDGVHGGELWSSDGTQAGTRIVADLLTAAGEGAAPAKGVITSSGSAFLRG